jgi:hypothetical protein
LSLSIRTSKTNIKLKSELKKKEISGAMSVLVALEQHYFQKLINWWHSPFNRLMVKHNLKLVLYIPEMLQWILAVSLFQKWECMTGPCLYLLVCRLNKYKYRSYLSCGEGRPGEHPWVWVWHLPNHTERKHIQTHGSVGMLDIRVCTCLAGIAIHYMPNKED